MSLFHPRRRRNSIEDMNAKKISHNKHKSLGFDDNEEYFLDNSTSTISTVESSSSREESSSFLSQHLPATAPCNDVEEEQPQRQAQKRVSFGTIEINEHVVEIPTGQCSYPSSGGVPIGIGWECQTSHKFDLEEYEELLPPRRQKDQMILDAKRRQEMLLEWGYTLSEIRRQTTNCDELRKKHSSQQSSHSHHHPSFLNARKYAETLLSKSIFGRKKNKKCRLSVE